MNLLRRVVLRLRAIIARPALENDMQHEIRSHLDQATQRYRARGMSDTAAQLAARREFGNVTMIEEEGRDARGARWVDALRGDVRFAVRYFARHKATVAIIVAVLALGTGANTVIFSIFQAEFLRPAPAVPDDDARARIWVQERASTTAPWALRDFTGPELEAVAQRRDIFTGVAAWTRDDVALQAGDSAIARGVGMQFVTPNFWTTLGVPLAAGPGFANGSEGAPDMTAVMAHAVATQLYGTPANAIGRDIRINEMALRVVGVAPPRFQGAMKDMDEPSLWVPLSARASILRIPARWMEQDAVLSLFGRLSPNASREQASAFVAQLVTNTLPDSAARVGMARSAHVQPMYAPPPGNARLELVFAFVLMSAIGILVLLVAWMNVSSLMVAAAVGRRHEIAVRLSLGASRARLLRQLVTESTTLAVAGGAAGLLMAWWFLSYIATSGIEGVDISPDFGTFAFTFAVAAATGIVFGLSPAAHATRGVAGALRDAKSNSVGRARLQRGFVVAQIMLSQPLLVLLGTMLSMVVADYKPFASDMSHEVVDVRLHPMETAAPGQRREAVDALVPRIAERADVVAAVPDATGFDVRRVVAPERAATNDRPDAIPSIVNVEAAAPGWFALLDVPILFGRDVTLADTAAAERPVVIGSDLARALWGDANPVGRTLASPPLLPGQDSVGMTVVGVYDATHRLPGMTWGGHTARGNVTVRIFTAHGAKWRRDRVLVRTQGPAEPFLPELHRFIRDAAPSLPVTDIRTLAQIDAQEYLVTLRMSLLAGAGGGLALLLASLGLYGVVSLAVQQRTREIGIRIAVGAHPARVARAFLASGVRVSGLALVLGLPLSVLALKIGLSRNAIIAPGVNPYLIGAVIATILLGVACAATWLPARRAARVDPATSLRVE